MTEKGLRSPAVRRILTIVLLLGISGTFMSFYYLLYLPQKQADFNQRMFRRFHEIADHLSYRAEYYGRALSNSLINKSYPDPPVSFKNLYDKDFDTVFRRSFHGMGSDSKTLANYSVEQHFKHDSLVFEVRDTSNKVIGRSQNALSDILRPLISIHAKTFESVLLIKLTSGNTEEKPGNDRRYDAILYKSSGFDIANINTDSLFPNKSIQAATLNEIIIEGIKYKIFLMPFQMKLVPDETFVLGGIISLKNYNKLSQDIPLDFLLIVVFILVFVLLCLPFLKVFVLSSQENISIGDIRYMIASIFIIPFVITLLISSIWLYFYPDRFNNSVLSSLQNELKTNFYKEIQECITQAKEYDSIIMNPSVKIWKEDTSQGAGPANISGNKKLRDGIKELNERYESRGIGSLNMKDVIFYPARYRNIENIHWIDSAGNDIAAWRFTKDAASYFNVRERQYFKDIKYRLGYTYPNSTTTFSFQATLSLLNGEYTINTVIPSRVQILPGKTSILTAVTSRMYSVYNTIVPPGFSYCLIDQQGNMIFHSDTARNLQENLLRETGNNQFLQNAISHKDSVCIDNVQLYDGRVKMIIRPFDNMPYYLVTYYNKRTDYLFIFHIGAFVFLSMSLLILFVSLFSYCIMMTNKKVTKLLFEPGILGWLKPSAEKKDYYIRNCIQQIAILMLVWIFSIFLSPQQDQLYILNYALLLPLFSVTGYYIVKKAKDLIVADKEQNQLEKNQGTTSILLMGRKHAVSFLHQIKYILLMYILSVLIFGLLQNILIYNRICPYAGAVKFRIWILIFLLPFIMCFIAGININYLRKFSNRVKVGMGFQIHYLTPFIISLMFGVLSISVVPSITLTRYALNEERMLHFQTLQMGLAKKMQERRSGINQKLWQTKLGMFPDTASLFLNSLKFSPAKGLYLGGLSVETGSFFDDNVVDPGKTLPSQNRPSDTCCSTGNTLMITCAVFYKKLTQFLFLPPDHDEFYNNVNNRKYYYWNEARYKKSGGPMQHKVVDSLYLYYNNLTDHRDPADFVLGGELPYFYLFQDITHQPLILLMLLVAIFIFLYYKIISSAAKRIFMIGYFDQTKTPDTKWLNRVYTYLDQEELKRTSCFPVMPISFAQIRERENQLLAENDECVLKIHLALIPVYERIWNECNDDEKYTLYDFALDGFTNYKKVIILFQLFQKGLLIKDQDSFHLMTISFRNFLLTKEKSETIKTLSKQVNGSWSAMRTIFYVIILVVAVFIFLSQEEASKRLITIVTSLGALLPAILKLFEKSSFSSGANQSGQ